MSEPIAKKAKEAKQPVLKRADARKDTSKEREVTRETRVPMGGFAGPLTLQNKDPNFHYYWEIDTNEGGAKIERRLQAGYVFCKPEEGIVAGTTSVYATSHSGSVIRVPAGQGEYHYLMRIPLEWYEEDMARIQERVNLTEQSLKAPKAGLYGGITTG